ncbi:MAG: KamA family radical SAM protein [Spirochaetia bacterium]|jgi:lysine 2,3-aminomutase|nr:KamA family radical SAM protein [Spirochaetia bacterium]
MVESDTGDWKKQLSECYRSVADFPENFKLSPLEAKYFKTESDRFQISIPEYYFSLASTNDDDPIRRQFMPQSGEQITLSCETDDPLGETPHKVTQRLIHRYRDRALFLASDTCAMYCRHCFRRDYLSTNPSALNKKEIENAAKYIRDHLEIKELIISGGDPLILDDSIFENLLTVFRDYRPDIIFRVASRMPVVLPSRITNSLSRLLSRFKPLFIITQFNHPKELTISSRQALSRLVGNGIPVFNQSVLLNSVNDSVDILAELCQELLRASVKPYYLFQGDLAAGTSHMRVPIIRGFEIMKELRTKISGLAMPVYAVDLPGGGGKILLTESYIQKITDTEVIFKDPSGKEYSYPVETP